MREAVDRHYITRDSVRAAVESLCERADIPREDFGL